MTLCKRSGIEFEAASNRVKQHPVISDWLQKANKEGWYTACAEAIASLRESGAKTIDEFSHELEAVREDAITANQQRQAEQKAYWKSVEQQKKERRSMNTALRRAGYAWRRCDKDMFEIFTDEKEWILFTPEGERTTVEAALKLIGYPSKKTRGSMTEEEEESASINNINSDSAFAPIWQAIAEHEAFAYEVDRREYDTWEEFWEAVEGGRFLNEKGQECDPSTIHGNMTNFWTEGDSCGLTVEGGGSHEDLLIVYQWIKEQ